MKFTGMAVKKPKYKDPNLKRINRHMLLFNNRELSAINKFCRQYKVSNKSKFMREAIIKTILKKFDEDYPTLFEEEQPTLFSRIQN